MSKIAQGMLGVISNSIIVVKVDPNTLLIKGEEAVVNAIAEVFKNTAEAQGCLKEVKVNG